MACKASARASPVRPQPRVSLESASGIMSEVGSRRKKSNRREKSNLLVLVVGSRAQGFSQPLACRQSSYSLSSPNMVLTHSTVRAASSLRLLRHLSRFPRQNYLPLARSHAPQEYHIVYNQKRRTRRNRPCTKKLHCVSTNRLNRVDSELISYVKVNSGLTPAGKTTLNKYP